jgi:hypothetical protein
MTEATVTSLHPGSPSPAKAGETAKDVTAPLRARRYRNKRAEGKAPRRLARLASPHVPATRSRQSPAISNPPSRLGGLHKARQAIVLPGRRAGKAQPQSVSVRLP